MMIDVKKRREDVCLHSSSITADAVALASAADFLMHIVTSCKTERRGDGEQPAVDDAYLLQCCGVDPRSSSGALFDN